MITKTFGAGGTYATLKDAIDSTPSFGATYSDDYDIVQVGDSIESGMVSVPQSTANMNGHTLTIRSSSPHNGDPTAGYKITSNLSISIAFNGHPVTTGTLVLQDLNISNNAGAILNAGSSYPNSWTRGVIFNRCILITEPAKAAINIQGVPVNVICSKVTSINFNVTAPPPLTDPMACVIENCSVRVKIAPNGYPATIRNCFSLSFANTTVALGYNNALIGNPMNDSTWLTGSSGNIGNVIAADEFKSTTVTDATYLFLIDGAVGTLATAGTIPTLVSADIAGLAIPYGGNYPIGCHISYVPPPPKFPEMIIDSGAVYKDYGLETEVLIGATRGGNKFWVEQEITDTGYDGRGQNVKGAKKITRVQPFIETNLIEISPDLLLSALPASASANGATQHTVTRALQISLSDYIDNITIVGEIHGNALPIICMIKNALCVGNFEMGNNDKSETGLTLKFAGHFDDDDLNTEPWEIRYPRA